VKAGGTGLNLTAASHVFHFDQSGGGSRTRAGTSGIRERDDVLLGIGWLDQAALKLLNTRPRQTEVAVRARLAPQRKARRQAR